LRTQDTHRSRWLGQEIERDVVVAQAVLKLLAPVVDDNVGAERATQFGLAGTRGRRYLSGMQAILGQLERCTVARYVRLSTCHWSHCCYCCCQGHVPKVPTPPAPAAMKTRSPACTLAVLTSDWYAVRPTYHHREQSNRMYE